MQIQVILRKVGEHRQSEFQRRHFGKSQRVGGHLHHHMRHTGVTHGGKQRVQFRRVRGRHIGKMIRIFRMIHLIAYAALHRTNQTARIACHAQNMIQHHGNRGFPVCPCDSDQAQLLCRVPPKRVKQPGKRLSCIRHDKTWHPLYLPLGNQQHCTVFHRFFGKIRAVGMKPADCHENPAGQHFGRIRKNPGNLCIPHGIK